MLDRLALLKDKSPVEYGNFLYPSFHQRFQVQLAQRVLSYIKKSNNVHRLETSIIKWLERHRRDKDVLFQLFEKSDQAFDLVHESWEEFFGTPPNLIYHKPYYVPHIEPQRFATLFLYLNTIQFGGSTVFIYAQNRSESSQYAQGCSDGLAIPAQQFKATLFYSVDGDMQANYLAMHEGCAPLEKAKLGSNQFMWNSFSDEALDAWT